MHGELQRVRQSGTSSYLEFRDWRSSPVSQLETDSSYNGTGYDYNASSTLSVTTGTGFMAMFFWTLLSLL